MHKFPLKLTLAEAMQELSPEAQDAFKGALVSRGKRKGILLASAPSRYDRPMACAAWQALTLSVNPFKASISYMAFDANRDTPEAKVYKEILAWTDKYDLRAFDRDRANLEALGVW